MASEPDMTIRLYHTDQRLTEFTATVVDRAIWQGGPAVVLDHTAFYPASGGQPSDRGTIDGVDVLDVVVSDENAVLHVLADEVVGPTVRGSLDWPRRFDHMQQHSGQHVLSAAFEQLLDADTVGFHLGSESSTVDINVARLDPREAAEVEALANRIIWEDRPTTARFVSEGEWGSLSLRRAPTVAGRVRIVTVGGGPSCPDGAFDVNACGGTHVAATGEIGLLKTVRLEYRGDQTRIEFLCGGRALRDYLEKHEILSGLASHLTVGYWELGATIQRMEEEAKVLRRSLGKAKQQLAEYEANELVHSGSAWGPYSLISRVLPNLGPPELRSLAVTLAGHEGTVVALATIGERTHLCFARSEGVGVDVSAMVRTACEALNGKGGGRPHLAQGSAPVVDRTEVERALEEVASSHRPTAGRPEGKEAN